MLEVPAWLQTLIASAVALLIGGISGRRLARATVGEKEANAAKTLSTLADDLAKQLARAVESNTAGRQKILEQEDSLRKQGQLCLLSDNLAQERQNRIIELEGRLADVNDREPLGLEKAEAIRKAAEIIVEEIGHISYLKDPDEPEGIVERRFKTMRAAAREIVSAMEASG